MPSLRSRNVTALIGARFLQLTEEKYRKLKRTLIPSLRAETA
jgi:hypothetical protein